MLESRRLPAALLAVIVNTLCYINYIEMATTGKQDLANKTDVFINLIKETLRKDNDDYIELRGANRQTYKADIDKLYYKKVTRNTLFNKNIININSKDSARRLGHTDNKEGFRKLLALRTPVDGPRRQRTPKSKRKENLTVIGEVTTSAPNETTISPTMTPDYTTPMKKKISKKVKSKQETLQEFSLKNMELIKNYLSSRNMMSSTPKTPLSSTTPLIIPSENKNKAMILRLLSSKIIPPNIPNTSFTPPSHLLTTSSSSENLYLRGLTQSGPSEEDESDQHIITNPELLDMLPARGARLHSLWLKGRLCDRNVLFPEGPKYDSAGAPYIRRHDTAASRDFAGTRSPKYILPRCCNCCKKSVLGCE